MYKLVILLSCLACWTAAGRLGLERKLHWLQNIHGVGGGQNNNNMDLDNLTVEQKHQIFLLDVLLQVHKPLVNAELIEMGKILITEPALYDEPMDDLLLEFLEQAREHDIVGRQHQYNALNSQHARQLVGLYKFLVLPSDWRTFQRNVCFARLHMNPVMLVNALMLALNERSDTQQLKMPALNEILPQQFYEKDIIMAAQQVEWDALTGEAMTTTGMATLKPTIMDVLGLRRLGLHLGKASLWHPLQQWRMHMLGAKAGAGVGGGMGGIGGGVGGGMGGIGGGVGGGMGGIGGRMGSIGSGLGGIDTGLGGMGGMTGIGGLTDDSADMLIEDKQKIVVPVQQAEELCYLTDDVGLNIFWSTVMNERLVQTVAGGKQQQQLHLLGGSQGQHMSEVDDMNMQDILGQQRMNKWTQLHSTGKIGGNSQNNWGIDSGEDNAWNKHNAWNKDNTWNANNKLHSKKQNQWQQQQNQWQDDVENIGTGTGAVIGWGNSDAQSDTWKGANKLRKNYQRQQQPWQDSVQHSGIGHGGMGWSTNDDDDKTDMWRSGISGNGGRQTGRSNGIWGGNQQQHQSSSSEEDSDEDVDNINWGGMKATNIKKLPVSDIGNRRLLHVSRRRLRQQQQQQQQGNQMWGTGTHGGRSGMWQTVQNNNQDNGIGQWWAQQGDDDDVATMLGQRQGGKQHWQLHHSANARVITDDGGQSWQKKSHQHMQSSNMAQWQQDSDEDSDEQGLGQGILGANNNVRDNVLKWGHIIEKTSDPADLNNNNNNNWNAPQTWGSRTTSGSHKNRWMGGSNRMQNIGIDDDNNENENSWHQRKPRSISNLQNVSPIEELKSLRSGEIFMQNLQQLMARINMEKIAVSLEGTTGGVVGRSQQTSLWNAQTWTTGTTTNALKQNWQATQATQNAIQKLKAIIDGVLERQQISTRSDAAIQVIGDILVQQNGQQGGNIWDELHQQIIEAVGDLSVGGIGGATGKSTQLAAIPTGNLRAPLEQHIIDELVHIIDHYKQQLQPHTVEDLIVEHITVNDVDVDRLITHMELVDADLINLVDQQLLQSDVNNIKKLQKKIVARQQRLNHQAFTIRYDITAERQQTVVVRTLLGPKVDANGRPISLNENRKNFILLDAFVQNLQAGANVLQRNSRDISWTNRDVTTLSQIYQGVMTGKPLTQLVGADCRFPQRLLIPRGTVDGLPMQLLVIVTPVMGKDRALQQMVVQSKQRICGLGIAGIHLDRLPLDFPLDRKIVGVQHNGLPNMLLKDVIIQHDDQLHAERI